MLQALGVTLGQMRDYSRQRTAATSFYFADQTSTNTMRTCSQIHTGFMSLFCTHTLEIMQYKFMILQVDAKKYVQQTEEEIHYRRVDLDNNVH